MLGAGTSLMGISVMGISVKGTSVLGTSLMGTSVMGTSVMGTFSVDVEHPGESWHVLPCKKASYYDLIQNINSHLLARPQKFEQSFLWFGRLLGK